MGTRKYIFKCIIRPPIAFGKEVFILFIIYIEKIKYKYIEIIIINIISFFSFIKKKISSMRIRK